MLTKKFLGIGTNFSTNLEKKLLVMKVYLKINS